MRVCFQPPLRGEGGGSQCRAFLVEQNAHTMRKVAAKPLPQKENCLMGHEVIVTPMGDEVEVVVIRKFPRLGEIGRAGERVAREEMNAACQRCIADLSERLGTQLALPI